MNKLLKFYQDNHSYELDALIIKMSLNRVTPGELEDYINDSTMKKDAISKIEKVLECLEVNHWVKGFIKQHIDLNGDTPYLRGIFNGLQDHLPEMEFDSKIQDWKLFHDWYTCKTLDINYDKKICEIIGGLIPPITLAGGLKEPEEEPTSPHNELGSNRPYSGDDIDTMLETVRGWKENDEAKYLSFINSFPNAGDRISVGKVIGRGNIGKIKIGASSDLMQKMISVFRNIIGNNMAFSSTPSMIGDDIADMIDTLCMWHAVSDKAAFNIFLSYVEKEEDSKHLARVFDRDKVIIQDTLIEPMIKAYELALNRNDSNPPVEQNIATTDPADLGMSIQSAGVILTDWYKEHKDKSREGRTYIIDNYYKFIVKLHAAPRAGTFPERAQLDVWLTGGVLNATTDFKTRIIKCVQVVILEDNNLSSESVGMSTVYSGQAAIKNATDSRGNAYEGVDIGEVDILNSSIDQEVGEHIEVLKQEQVAGFDMGVDLDTEGTIVVEEFDDDETTLIRRHVTVSNRNLKKAQHLVYHLIQTQKYEYTDPSEPLKIINNDVAMESYLGSSELNTLYQIELVQDSLNMGVLSAEEQINDLASFINTNCPDRITTEGGATGIAIDMINDYLEIEKRLKAVQILSDDTQDLERGLIDIIRVTQ